MSIQHKENCDIEAKDDGYSSCTCGAAVAGLKDFLQTIQVDHFTDARIAAILAGDPLTMQERAFLLCDTPTFEEAQHLLEKELAKMDDIELMRTAHGVWADYASGQV